MRIKSPAIVVVHSEDLSIEKRDLFGKRSGL